MTAIIKKYGIVLMLVMAVVILATSYIVNGSERETAWLYIISFWLVIYAAFEAYSAMKKGKVRQKKGRS